VNAISLFSLKGPIGIHNFDQQLNLLFLD
jgi:hypothetical protein